MCTGKLFTINTAILGGKTSVNFYFMATWCAIPVPLVATICLKADFVNVLFADVYSYLYKM